MKRIPRLPGILALAVVLTSLVPQAAGASDQIPAPPPEHPIALVGGTIHPVTGSPFRGDLLIRDGRIAALGPNLDLDAAGDDVSVVDVTGRHVYPGLIAANTSLGLVEIAAVRATRDIAEVGDVKPNVRAEVAFNPDSELLPVTRSNGVALALSVPAGGLVSGTSALMELDGWTWEAMTLEAPVGLHVHWPSMGIRRGRPAPEEKRQKEERERQLGLLRDTFAEARAYHKAKLAEGKDGVPAHETDLRWEAMIPVLEKKVPVFVHANEIRQIEAAVRWAAEEDLRMVLVGGYDAARASDLLIENDVPVIVEGVHRLPRRRWEPYDAPFTLPQRLHRAGVRYCIAASGSSFEAPHQRNLPYHAAAAAAYGLPRDEALKAVTVYPARILGVDDRVGSLEEGKDATLIVTDGDPLEIRTRVEAMYIRGRKVDLDNRHRQLYRKYRTKYEQLGLLK
jgi:imidazolonepropionase-like amidohydrolase